MAKKKPPKKIKIVYFELCHSATRFARQSEAEAAAFAYSRQKGYGCEAFFCPKEHPRRNGSIAGPGWHVRGKVRPTNRTFSDVSEYHRPPNYRSETLLS